MSSYCVESFPNLTRARNDSLQLLVFVHDIQVRSNYKQQCEVPRDRAGASGLATGHIGNGGGHVHGNRRDPWREFVRWDAGVRSPEMSHCFEENNKEKIRESRC